MTIILIRKLDDHRILEILENDMESLTNIPIRKLDDHGILMKF